MDRIGQLELADKVGVSRRTIARLESAEISDPGIKQLRAIAEVLRVAPETLIDRPLRAVTIPLPETHADALEGPARAELLRKVIAALDE